MVKRALSIFLVFFAFTPINAQQIFNVDSLNNALKKVNKKEQVVILSEMINYYEKNNFDSALYLINQAVKLTKELRDIENEYILKTKSIGVNNAKGNFNEAIETAEKIIMEITSLSGISVEKKNSLTYESYNFIGIANANMSNYSNALYYYQKNLELAKKIGSESRMAVTLTNIGLMYYNLYEDDKALSYYSQSKKLYEKNNNKEGLSGIALNIGAVYHEQGDLATALENYNYSLNIEIELKDKKGQSFALNNIADIYRLQKKYDLALEYNQKNLALVEELGNIQSFIYAYNNFFDLYKEMGKLEKAKEYAQKAYDLAEKHHLPLLVLSALENLSKISEEQNNFKDALNYQKLIVSTKDSLSEKSKSKTLLELEAKYQNEQNQKDIQLKNAEIASQKSEVEKKNLQTRILMIGILAVLILAIVILYNFNQKKKINEKLEAINDELEKLSLVARETDNVVIVADKKGKIEWINESYTKIYGYTINEFKEKFGETLLAGSSNPKITSLIKKCMTEKVSVEYVIQNETKFGNKIWVQTTMTPVLSAAGEIEKFILIDSDITKLQDAQLEIEKQSKLLETKNEQIIDSIDYAKRIQKAIFPSRQLLKDSLPEHFVLFKPKDIVSGDFYWVKEQNDEMLFAVADCTGHGVPGAFMSIISINILNNIALTGETSPEKILNDLGKQLIKNLSLSSSADSIKDGLDIALCSYSKKNNLLRFSGAHNSLYLLRDHELIELPADKIHIGKTDAIEDFTCHQLEVKSNDVIYLFTDGFVDQKGGEKMKKFYYPPFRELLISINDKEMIEQATILDNTINDWMKNTSQIDDMCIMGIKFKEYEKSPTNKNHIQ